MKSVVRCDTVGSHESMACCDTAGPYGIMETVLTVMSWSDYLEQRLDKVKRLKWMFIKGLQWIHLGSQKPPRGYTQDGQW